jgi:fibronectin-binding autotransporter adhesin
MKLISQELVGLNSRRLGSLLHRRLMQTALLAAVVGAGLSAHAATLTWDPTATPATPAGGAGNWDLVTQDWSNGTTDRAWTDVSASGTDLAVFGGTGGAVALNTSLSALGLQFNAPGYTLSGTGLLTVGSSGISATASAAIGSNLALGAGNQLWNVSAGQTLTLTGTLTRAVGNTLTLQGGAGTIAASNIPITNSIIGSWAVVNTGGVYSYGTVTGGNIVPYTGATQETSNAGAYGGIPSSGNGTVNYDITANGTLPVTGLLRTVSTLRYLGTGAAQPSNLGSGSAAVLNANGIMNSGTGTFTLGVTGTPSTGYLDIIIGANNDLVLGAMTANLVINNYILNGTGAGAVTIMGTNPNNAVTINGANTYTGGTFIDSGKLIITNAAGLSASSGTSIRTGGTLDVQGNLTNAGVGGLVMTGLGTGSAGALVSSTTGSLGGNVVFSGVTSVGGAGNLTLSGTVSGSGTQLTKVGAGALTFTGANSYAGATSITAGALVLSGSGSINTSSGIALNGATASLVQNSSTAVSPTVTSINGSIDGSGTFNSVLVPTGGILGNVNGTTTLTLGTLTLQGAATLNFTTTNTSARVNVSTVAASGTGIVVNASNPSWTAGTYDLIGYGTLTGPFADFTKGTISGLTNRQTATLVNAGGFIALTVSGDNPVWTGALDGTWTTAVQSQPKNWALIISGTSTDYQEGDTVRFDDSASGTTTVSISTANVSPAHVTFANNNRAYTINGPFGIAGTGSVSITGTGSVTLNTVNTYSGGTTTGNGTLNINNASAIGTGPLTISGGTIDNTSSGPLTLTSNNVQNWNADFTFGGTNDLNLGTGAVVLPAQRNITTNNSANLTVGGVISGAFGISKAGTGNLVFTGTNTYSGTTIIDNGTLIVAGGVTGTLTTSGNSDIQISPNSGDNGTLEVTGGVVNDNRVIIGGNSANGGSPGFTAAVIQTGGVINSQEWFTVGSGISTTNSYATGTYTLSGGVLNILSQQMEIANFAGTSGTVNMSGASSINIDTNSYIALGANPGASDGTFNQNGGNVTFYSDAGVTAGGTGILYLGKAASLPGSNYTYNLNAGILTVPEITQTAANGANGVFNFNGGTLRAAVNSTNWIFGLSQIAVLTGGAIIDDNGHTVTITEAITDGSGVDGGLTKQGSGTLTLTGANSYNGPTIVNAGKLVLSGNGSINSSSGITLNGGKLTEASPTALTPPVTINGGGTLTGSNSTVNTITASAGGIVANGNNDTGVLTIGTLSFTSTGSLNATLAGAAATAAPGIVVGTLTTSGGGSSSTGHITVNATNATWNSGVYDLVGYSSLVGPGFSDFVLGTVTGLTPRQSANLTNVSGDLALTVSAGNSPIWTGAVNNNWTTAVLGLPKNWKLQTGGTTTDFITGDTVIFDDSSSVNNINISDANVSPISVTFNNSTANYTISSTGGFGIATGFVVMNGTGAVTLTTANTYAGGTTVNAGKLNINNAAALGTGALTLAGGATIDNTSGSAITLAPAIPVNVNGDITFTGTNNLSLGTSPISIGGTGTARTITVGGSTLTVGKLTFTGLDFVKAGAGTLTILTPVVDDSAVSSTTGVLNVTGGKLNIGANDFTATGLAGSGTVADGSATSRLLIVTNAANTTFSGSLQDGGAAGTLGLTENGTGILTLSGTSSYTGPTNILGGATVIMASPTAFGNTSTIQLGGSFGTPSLGTLIVRTDGGDTPYVLNQGSNNSATIESGVLTGSTGINHTLGNLSIGIAATLNITAGPNVTGGNPSITLGNVSFTSGIGAGSTTFNPTTASLTIGAVSTTTNTAKTLVLDGTATGNAVTGIISNGANVVSVTKSNTSQWTLSGASTFTGGTTVSGGTLVVANVLALGAGPLTVHTASTVQFQPGLASSVRLPSLTLDGSTGSWAGLVNLANDSLIVTPTDSTTLPTVLAQIQDQVNFGKTNGTGGIIASGLAPNQPFLVLQAGSTGVFVGADVVGDTNGDGAVNVTDLNTVLANLGTTTNSWTSGNFDGARTIDLTDLNDVLNHFGSSILTSSSTSNSSAAPEPASLSLLALGAAALIARRRKA